MKKRTWLIALKKRIRLVTLLTLATAMAFVLWQFVPGARLYEKLSEKYSALSISDPPPAWYYASIILLAVLLMALIWLALQIIPKRQARALQKPESPIVIGEQRVNIEGFTTMPQSAVKPTELFSIENEARKTLSQIIGGFVVIIGLLFTGANLAITQREAEKNRSLALEGQITDRFTKAITQLGDEKLEVRLGGIYALERIAKDSEKDYLTIIEVLTAYVREHAPRKAKDNAVNPLQNRKIKNAEQKEVGKLPTDIQAVMAVIQRRTIFKERGLYYTKIVKAASSLNFIQTELPRATLITTDLEGANFSEANLSKADFIITNLSGANLSWANLNGANLNGANLNGANLNGANLNGANLKRVSLEWADLGGANLNGAYLFSANLRSAVNLTWEQISQAIIDDETKLPDKIENTHKDELRAMREKTKEGRDGK
jgi:hypothetical protein